MHFPRHLFFTVLTIVLLAVALVAPPADATLDSVYEGPGINENGHLVLKTGQFGVSYYRDYWHRTVCGIHKFNIYFTTNSPYEELTVDADGNFGEAFSFTYQQSGRRYKVRATNIGKFGPYAEQPGYTNDQVWVKQTVRVKRIKKGARWCSATPHEFLGFKL